MKLLKAVFIVLGTLVVGASMLALMLFGLIWLVGSGYYLVTILGEFAFTGEFITISELDGRGPDAVHTEMYLFWGAVTFWVSLAIYGFSKAVRAEMAK